MKRWEHEGWLAGVTLPQTDEADSETILNYLFSLNPDSDMIEDRGTLVPMRVERFTRFERRQVSLDWFDPSQWHEPVSPSLANIYAQESGDSAPPIVVDGIDHAVIDGFHRLRAARQRGDTHILAFVGTDLRPGWIPHEDHPFEVAPETSSANQAARRTRAPR